MAVLCSLGWHRPDSKVVSNLAYRFSTCTQCHADIVDQGDGVWRSIPRGFQVVWRPVERKRTVLAKPAARDSHHDDAAGGASPNAAHRDPADGVAADSTSEITAPETIPMSAPPAELATLPHLLNSTVSDDATIAAQDAPAPPRGNVLAELWDKARTVWQPRAAPAMPASRSYRYLAQQVMADFPHADRGTMLLVSAACAPGTEIGATMLFAAMLQDEAGGRLLVVDATLRDGGIGAALGDHGAPGFLNLLNGDAAALPATGSDSLAGERATALDCDPLALVQPSGRDNIWFIPAGTIEPRGAAAPDPERIAAIFDTLATAYDHIIVVQQTITTDTRYVPIARAAAAVLMLVEETESRMADITRYLAAFSAHGIDDVRLVLCAQDPAEPAAESALQHAA